MNSLVYYKFLENLGRTKHFQVPSVLTPGSPLEIPNEDKKSAILNQVESGAIHPVIFSRKFIEKHSLAPNNLYVRHQHFLSMRDVPFEIPMPFDSIWVEFLLEQEAGNPMLAAVPLLAGPDSNPQIYGYLLERLTDQSEPAYLITAYFVVVGSRGIRELATASCKLTKSDYRNISQNGPRDALNIGLIWHHQLFEILNHMCSEKQVGLDKTKVKFRSGTGKDRRALTVKNIVYVVPTAERASFNERHGTKVEWSHRWETRGHWRKVENIGKDPEGNYCVPGMTWVRPSIKGPDKAPLVRKTRLALPAKQLAPT